MRMPSSEIMRALDQILEPARRRDDDVRALEPLRLRADRRAAVGERRPGRPSRAANELDLVGDLERELAGRHEHERLGASRRRAATRSTSGMPKASVLPEPVGDFARMSRPASASGRTRDWMRNGSTMPRAASACSTAALTPSALNECFMWLFDSLSSLRFEITLLETTEGGTRS